MNVKALVSPIYPFKYVTANLCCTVAPRPAGLTMAPVVLPCGYVQRRANFCSASAEKTYEGCAGSGLMWIFGGAGLTFSQQVRALSRRIVPALCKRSGLGLPALIFS